jgi:hypothetical protein
MRGLGSASLGLASQGLAWRDLAWTPEQHTPRCKSWAGTPAAMRGRGQTWPGAAWPGGARLGKAWIGGGDVTGSSTPLPGQTPLPRRQPPKREPAQVDPEQVRALPTRSPIQRSQAEVQPESSPDHKRRPYWVDNPPDRSDARVPPSLRALILDRDGWCCRYCSTDLRDLPSELVDVDHVIPRHEGGPSLSPGNLTASCWNCNRGPGGKSGRSPEAWRQWRLARGLPWPPPRPEV